MSRRRLRPTTRRLTSLRTEWRPRRELPGAGPRVAGIDGELRVDARGRHATHLIHKRVEEAGMQPRYSRASQVRLRSGLGDFFQKLEYPLESLAVRRAQQPGQR